MTKRKFFFLTCLILSTLCWLGGYAFNNLWPGTVFSLILGLIWLLAWSHSSSPQALFCLIASIILGGAGVILGLMPWLMICGAAAALGAWDLLSLNLTLGKLTVSTENKLYENQHLKTLGLTLGAGLLIALLGELLSFQIPFFVLLLLVVGLIFLLERIWNFFKKRQIKA
jgi:hypothetical protein